MVFNVVSTEAMSQFPWHNGLDGDSIRHPQRGRRCCFPPALMPSLCSRPRQKGETETTFTTEFRRISIPAGASFPFDRTPLQMLLLLPRLQPSARSISFRSASPEAGPPASGRKPWCKPRAICYPWPCVHWSNCAFCSHILTQPEMVVHKLLCVAAAQRTACAKVSRKKEGTGSHRPGQMRGLHGLNPQGSCCYY